MKKVLPAFLVMAFISALIGCQEDASAGADMNAPISKGPAIDAAKKPGGKNPELGSAELTPGMSAAEADKRVGSAIK